MVQKSQSSDEPGSTLRINSIYIYIYIYMGSLLEGLVGSV